MSGVAAKRDAESGRTGALARAREGDREAFAQLVEPHRHELMAHCYRMLGSVQDAEDALQEALLAAWRGLDGFRGQGSLRSWLHRIATNRCLNALRAGARQPREVRPRVDLPEPTRIVDPSWVEPYPDSLLEGVPDDAPGPDARYELKEAISLAFITALQRLPVRQRAVLILRDVLGFRAAEVAGMIDTSEDAVHSALKRARATIDILTPHEQVGSDPTDRAGRAVAARFAETLENDDIDALVTLLTQDAILTMPPEPLEYQGPEVIAAFMRDRCSRRVGRGFRLVPLGANGQPAFGCYLIDGTAPVARPHGIFVLTVREGGIAAITRFLDNSVYPYFGLPRMLRL